MTLRYWRVRNWEQFQHYGKRTPPWIKLYHALLSDYHFTRLPDPAKAHLVCLFLVASRTKNRIPDDAEYVAQQIGAHEPVDLQLLAAHGFLELHEDASNAPPTVASISREEEEPESEENKMLVKPDLLTRIVVEANLGLRDNPKMRGEGEVRPLTGHTLGPVLAAWQAKGIPDDVILTTVRRTAQRFSPTSRSRRIAGFNYFTPAVEQAWEEAQAKPAPAKSEAERFRELMS